MPSVKSTKHTIPDKPYDDNNNVDCMTVLKNIKSEYTKDLYNNKIEYSKWVLRLRDAYRKCKGSNNQNACEEDIGVLSEILYKLNFGQSGEKKGGSKQTGGTLIPELLTKLNNWIYNNRGIISDCAKYFLEKIYGAVAKMIITEATLHQDSHTFQFLITVISYLNQDVPLPGEETVKGYIQNFLFQNIQAASKLQELSLRDLVYYTFAAINLYQYVDPAKGVVLGAIDTISGFSQPLIDYIQSEDFLKLLYNISQSGILTAGLLVNTSFSLLPPDKQVKIKNIYTLIDHNIARIIAEYIKNGYTDINEKLGNLIRSNYEITLKPFDEHLKDTFIKQKMANALEIADITNQIQIAKDDISDASLVLSHDTEITRLKTELSDLKTQLIAILPPGPPPPPLYLPTPPLGGKRGKSTRRKIGSRKNKRVQKKKSTKKR